MKYENPFDVYYQEYDRWYEKNKSIYDIELKAIQEIMPFIKNGVEIGVGSGRFASILGIGFGIDPSINMLSMAKKRGITPICGIAEHLPIKDLSFDLVLMITTICFLKNVNLAFKEANRILKREGYFILGFIDKNTVLGKEYVKKQHNSLFYRNAKFLSSKEVITRLNYIGFKIETIRQCIFTNKSKNNILEGYGEGGFVVIKARKVSK